MTVVALLRGKSKYGTTRKNKLSMEVSKLWADCESGLRWLSGVYIQNVLQEMGDQNMGKCGHPDSILKTILLGMWYKTYHKSIKSISKSLGYNEKIIPREFYYNFVFSFQMN